MSKPGLALVTGGNSGIGLDLARLFARDGHDLVLVARDAGRLEQAAAELRGFKVNVETCVADLGRPGGLDAVKAALGDRVGKVEVLVNNAGYGLQGAFAETPLEAELGMLQVNVVALTALTKWVLPGMVAARRGRILNVGSTAGFPPGPFMAVYYASKAYVNSLSQALSAELEGTGVTVTVLCPGPVETRFQAQAGMEGSRLMQMRAAVLPSAEVAEQGYRAMREGEPLVVPGLVNKLGVFGQRFLPRAAITAMTRRLNSRES
ncbi:MAG: short-chain dehydrogenase [Pseudomonadota bacterium]